MDHPITLEQLLAREPEPQVICFDFFDTLVYRTIEPEHTKRLASRRLSLLLNSKITSEALYQMRRRLEAALCEENRISGGDLDFYFPNFCEAFFHAIKKKVPELVSWFSLNTFTHVIQNIEVAVEKNVQRPFKSIVSLLTQLQDMHHQTALISDFYLPQTLFVELLDHHGVKAYFDHIFISADHGLTKGSGRLYDVVLNKLNITPDLVMMIGDNQHSDIHMAQAKGLQTFHFDQYRQRRFYRAWNKKNADSRQRNRLQKDQIDAVIKRHGGPVFPEMGLTLWRFTQKLFEQLITDRVRDIFFFSKEGEFLKKLFDQFQTSVFGGKVIHSHYLLVSRKSTYIASLRPLDQEDFFRIFMQYREISPREFLMSLNFDDKLAKKIATSVGIDFEKRLPDFPQSDIFHKLIASHAFKGAYEDLRLQQKKYLTAYLHAFGVDIHRFGLHIVDVGWKGSIQHNLFQALDGNVSINGYYIGLLEPVCTSLNNRKKGILFTNSPLESPFFTVYNNNRSLFEMLLGATHGSADFYTDRDPHELQVLRDHFAVTQTMKVVTGNIHVLTIDLPEERALYQEKIVPIQRCMYTVASKLSELVYASEADLPNNRWFAKHHARMVFHPKNTEVDRYESFYHLENFGVFEFTTFKNGEKIPIRKRIRNLKQACTDPDRILETGFWPPIILRKLGIGFYRHIDGLYRKKKAFGNAIQTDRPLIAFLLGMPEISGGTNVILEYAVRLNRYGYRVLIITEERIDPVRFSWHPDAHELCWTTFAEVKEIFFIYAIATWWRSILDIDRINAKRYIYFVQSIESRFFMPKGDFDIEILAWRSLCQKTYMVPIPIITEAKWIKTYLSEKFGIEAAVVPNGIRKDLYSEKGDCYAERTHGKLRVLVEGPVGVAHKNVEKTISLCCQSKADEIWLLTSATVDEFPGVDRIFSCIPINETPKVYRSCDVLVKLSYVEGMFGPPLEMFHCGGTAIVYDVTGHDEYIIHGKNGLIVQKDDEKKVIYYINLLKSDRSLLNRLIEGAKSTSKMWPDWQDSTEQFKIALKELCDGVRFSRTRLKYSKSHLLKTLEDDLNSRRYKRFVSRESDDYPQQRVGKNRLCLYYHFGEGFSMQNVESRYYEEGDWANIQINVPFQEKPLHIRIDPCDTIGIIKIKSIDIKIPGQFSPIISYNGRNGWKGILNSGTSKIVKKNSKLVLYSFGEDPQLLLPVVISDVPSKEVIVDISIKETSCRDMILSLIGS